MRRCPRDCLARSRNHSRSRADERLSTPSGAGSRKARRQPGGLYNYFCTERAELAVEGSLSSVPIQGMRGEYLWFVRDGYLVRSPVEFDGVRISPEEWEEKELEWIERLKEREAERGADREQFFGFHFEPGDFFFAGRRTFEGREVVVIVVREKTSVVSRIMVGPIVRLSDEYGFTIGGRRG